jgi:hypothetical protein
VNRRYPIRRRNNPTVMRQQTSTRFVDAAGKSVAYNDTITSMKCKIGTIAWGVVRHSVVGG